MRRWLLALPVSALVVSGTVAGIAATRSDGDAGPSPSRVATDRPCPELDSIPRVTPLAPGQVELRPVGTAVEPTSAVFSGDGSGDGFLGERQGRVLRIEGGQPTDDVVLDLRDDTMHEGDGGLLALAYGPGGDWLYVYRANAARDDTVSAYPIDAAGRLDADGGREIITVDHPNSIQHHGGALLFGRDELLYVGFGDGGGLGDPLGRAQDTTTLLGKVVRIDPTPTERDPYRIPADNPFVDDHRAAPEIWLLGVRNPFRLGLDTETGDLWLGDVGQSCWEEVNRLPSGAVSAGGSNLGWDHLEGTHAFEGGAVPGRPLDPEQEHSHRLGWCGIVSGYVIRNLELPSLDGRLLYTDFCTGTVLALDVDRMATDDRLVDTRVTVPAPTAIVPGPNGRPWVLSLEGAIFEIADRSG